MKLKIDNIVIPNLTSVNQSYYRESNFEKTTSASFDKVDNVDSIVETLKSKLLYEIVVLDEFDKEIAKFNVNSFESIDTSIDESLKETRVVIRFV